MAGMTDPFVVRVRVTAFFGRGNNASGSDNSTFQDPCAEPFVSCDERSNTRLRLTALAPAASSLSSQPSPGNVIRSRTVNR